MKFISYLKVKKDCTTGTNMQDFLFIRRGGGAGGALFIDEYGTHTHPPPPHYRVETSPKSVPVDYTALHQLHVSLCGDLLSSRFRIK